MSGSLNTDVLDYEGAVKPSSVEKAAYEENLYATRTCEIPTNMIGRWAYDSSNNCTYAGYAPKGLDEGTNGWLLQKFTWVSGNCTARNIAYGNWTAKASYTYN